MGMHSRLVNHCWHRAHTHTLCGAVVYAVLVRARNGKARQSFRRVEGDPVPRFSLLCTESSFRMEHFLLFEDSASLVVNSVHSHPQHLHAGSPGPS